jgi:hypothetical protein
MTKQQKRKILYDAAELIVAGRQEYSCVAITDAMLWSVNSPRELIRDYTRFYDDYFLYHTVKGLVPDLSPSERQELRILLLLFFAEAGI